MTEYTVQIVPDYVLPTTPIVDNAGYVDMVMNRAAQSYMVHFGLATPEEGITAAREEFNASLPVVPEV